MTSETLPLGRLIATSVSAFVLLSGLLLGGVQMAQAATTTYSGQATAVQATVLGQNPIVLSDTGALPPEGGSRENSLVEASVPGVLTAEALHASTVAHGDKSRAEASVASLLLQVGGNSISADFLMARSTASCTNQKASTSGSSEVAGLAINNVTITATGDPNQTVTLPNGRVIINEQTGSANGNTGDLTVNALHVIVDGIADVIVSSAHADITCQGNQACNGDFVTGGGWITGTPSGAKGNFGVAGGIKNGALWGHLTYIDHGIGLKAKGTGVTAYTVVDSTTRHIEGTAQINGQAGTYQVVVADHGEPGRDDTFVLNLSGGYSAGGPLEGGNIQLHKCR